jgi:Ni/Fe-hydrogenase subunit HybB-like protein
MDSKLRIFKDFLWFFAFVALVAGVFRLFFGLGPTTNLSDQMPWGLWKVMNMVGGVALSTSGFTVGFLYYVLKLKQFKPLVKPAILIAFLGYGSSCMALMFDIGLPHRFWHPIVMWNEHSFLFEVFWCVMIYFSVTAVELSPTILKRLGAEKIAHWLHKIAFGVVIFGISLSSLHHSSLGSLFLVTPIRLHALWYSALLPLFFIISAIAGGMMFLIFVRITYARVYDPEPIFGLRMDSGIKSNGSEVFVGPQFKAMKTLAIIASSILGVYLVLKIGDLMGRGAFGLLFSGSWESWLFIFELLITAVIPIALVAIPKTRRSPAALSAAGFSASLGLALNRVDVGIFGYFRDAALPYFPSLAEWGLSIGVVTAAILVFLFVCEKVPIFDESWKRRLQKADIFTYAYDKFSHVWHTVLMSGLQRVTLIAVVAFPLAWLLFYPPYKATAQSAGEIQPSIGLDQTRTMLLIDGNRAGVKTEFPHLDHQKRLGGEQSCDKCHHLSMPRDNATSCYRCHTNMLYEANIFDHFGHMRKVAAKENINVIHPANQSCKFCHDPAEPKSVANTVACTECHQQDMKIEEGCCTGLQLATASSYRDAMHETCIECHKQEEIRLSKANLSHCSTCHESLTPNIKDSVWVGKQEPTAIPLSAIR